MMSALSVWQIVFPVIQHQSQILPQSKGPMYYLVSIWTRVWDMGGYTVVIRPNAVRSRMKKAKSKPNSRMLEGAGIRRSSEKARPKAVTTSI